MNNAAERQSVRRAEKAARIAELNNEATIRELASTIHGRQWLYEKLAEANVFSSIFNSDIAVMSFLEGQRNAGLKLLGEIMEHVPEQFMQMMREANERRIDDQQRSPTSAEQYAGGEGTGRDVEDDDPGINDNVVYDYDAGKAH